MTRKAVPNRRPSEVVEFTHGGIRYQGSVSFDRETSAPCEVFLSGGKAGTAVEAVARDSAVAASLALQHGTDLKVIRAALTRNDDGSPAGPLGRLLDIVGEGI
jgi:hypothetical protein